MGRVAPQLSDALVTILREGRPVLLLTPGSDGFPSSAFTWSVALDPLTMRFGADHGSTSLSNLEREGRASLQIAAEEGMLYLVKGKAAQVKPALEAARPLGVALWELRVAEVRDQSWPGVRVQPLAYEWASERREEMLALERAVYAEMRGDVPLQRLVGVVVSGLGQGASFTQIPWARERLRPLLGADPHPGTLNLDLSRPKDLARWRALAARPGRRLDSPEPGSCSARAYPARVGDLPVLILVPEVPGYPPDRVELVASEHLRSRLGLADGDRLTLLVSDTK